ncbi:LysR family transcriptional regulator [Roseivivax halodurans JCM 10272]|uniref:LysR family transcriptional regulator n=1 Tax=Roseivivax halodurans JCM 10272 TaxID=1449350 RepID=X7EF80_9RHOB|nr:LysR family transcriptional regulator [Roseivivax halodurans]ETX14744.1 LysR family transcriptional regulator [Roseivivax halodurans JCM 10272]
MRNLDLTTLRSFAAVAETGGVTRAARMLNLTQSAVSMQLKRLEEMLGLHLLERSGRTVALTPAGEQLLHYARRMVALNDEIYARLTAEGFEGELVLGVPEDILYPVVPKVLQRFHAAYPRMRVQLVTARTFDLLEKLTAGELDLALTTEEGSSGETLLEAPLLWHGAPGGTAWKQRPLPFALSLRCAFRPAVLRRLDAAGIPWTQVIDTDSDHSSHATVAADLGVVAFLEGHGAPQLAPIDVGDALPDLGTFKINLHRGQARGAPADGLAEMVRQGFSALRPARAA